MDLNALIAAAGPYGWIVALALAAYTFWQKSKQPTAPTPDPATPAEPKPSPVKPADPFAPLPGLPGHPLLNLIGPALLRWIMSAGEGQVKMFAASPEPLPEQSFQDDVALSTIAAAVKTDPVRASKLAAMLKS